MRSVELGIEAGPICCGGLAKAGRADCDDVTHDFVPRENLGKVGNVLIKTT